MPGVEAVLVGSLVEPTWRCGKPGCCCAEGTPHGSYAYFVAKTAGRGVEVPVLEPGDGWCGPALVRRAGRSGADEISAINTELLARRASGDERRGRRSPVHIAIGWR